MAKNRNKKKNDGSAPMDITSNHVFTDAPEAMDTSESGASGMSVGGPQRKINKGVQMKRAKNVRKKKAMAKAISKSEIKDEKILKNESKKQRTHSAKNLYD